MLEIGSGFGLFSIYAAAMNAKEVLCLEPIVLVVEQISAGFHNPKVRWQEYNKCGFIGKKILAHGFFNAFLRSTFILNMNYLG